MLQHPDKARAPRESAKATAGHPNTIGPGKSAHASAAGGKTDSRYFEEQE